MKLTWLIFILIVFYGCLPKVENQLENDLETNGQSSISNCIPGSELKLVCESSNAKSSKQAARCLESGDGYKLTGSCIPEECDSGYSLISGVCSLDTQKTCNPGDNSVESCSIENATTANQTRTCNENGTGYIISACTLVTCDSGYTKSGNTCIADGDPPSTLPVFPGAEGVGTETIAGRFGQVIKVTNLNDSGPGSLRAALETNAPRIIVFTVSGIINLESTLFVRYPYVTVAGQTSPGGIIIAGKGTIINTNDVLIQHLRFRTGTHNSTQNEMDNLRAIEINGSGYPGSTANDGYNIVIDHCSFSWSADQTVNIQNDAYNVTLSWNFITEPLNDPHSESNHSYNLFMWGRYTQADRKFSVHHNFTSHSYNRNPEINYNGQLDFRNNVNYNSYYGVGLSTVGGAPLGSIKVNAIRNFNKYGPNTHVNNMNKPVLYLSSPPDGDAATPVLYIQGNIGEHRTLDTQAEELAAAIVRYSPFRFQPQVSAEYLSSSPFSFPDITTEPMNENYAEYVVENAGATKPVRDTVDIRVTNDYKNGTGSIKGNTSWPSDWPDLVTGAPSAPIDNDNDGMADSWEQANGLNTTIDDSALDHDNDGYTNIEEYIHSL